MELEIRRLPFDSAEAVALIDAVQAEYRVRYGGIDTTPVVVGEFAPPDGDFLIAFLDGEPVGSAGFRTVATGIGEIKRMYVTPAARGRGIARLLLAAIERSATAGCHRLILETGSKQPEALALYESSGYTAVPAFGTYRCEPGARHLGKDLQDEAAESGLLDGSATSRMST